MTTELEPATTASTPVELPLVDCDLHPAVEGGYKSLLSYLPEAWVQRLSNRSPLHIDNPQWTVRYPHPNAQSRAETIPPSGGAPASDPDFVATDFLDRHGIHRALLLPLQAAAVSAWSDPLEASVLVTAYNRFYAEHWLARDQRYRLAMCVAAQDPASAAAEIRSFGSTPGVASVWVGMLNILLGDGHYRPILQAAEEMGLPVVLHSTGTEGVFQGSPTIAGGIPTGFNERRILAPQIHQSNLVSLVFGGVFDRFPRLKVVFVECGWSWLPSLLWRMDVSWRSLRVEVPWVKRLPSEYVFEHVRFTTQPFEEPEKPEYLAHICDMIHAGQTLLFSSDYPHWDLDSPQLVLSKLPADTRSRVAFENAREVFGALLD
jgi:uncharacterized protein